MKTVTRHILLYQGVSLFSRAIQWQTWGKFSHVAIVRRDYRIVDAWKGGVRLIDDPMEGHSNNTRIWLADVRIPEDLEHAIDPLLNAAEGKDYAYGQFFNFLRRREPRAFRGMTCNMVPPDEIPSFVCSGLAQYAFCRAGWPLVQKAWYKTDPSDVAESTRVLHSRRFHGDWSFWTNVWRTHDAC